MNIAVTSPYGEPRAGGPGWPLAIAVTIPLGARFRFVEPQIRIAATDGEAGQPVVPDVRVRMQVSMPADGSVDLARFGPTAPDVARQALARDPGQTIAEARLGLGVLAGRAPQRVDVLMPAIEASSGRIELPPQALLAAEVRGTGYQALRTRERADRLAERQAACVRDSPRAACENISRYDTQSFEVATGPFTYGGRFWNFVAATFEPLRFEVRVAARTAEPWRLAAPVVHVTDRATGERHTQRFGEMQVALDYPVPLSTVIEGANADLIICLHLGDAQRSRYLVRLPAYELNGARHALKPIVLEVRRFDGGLEPFNC